MTLADIRAILPTLSRDALLELYGWVHSLLQETQATETSSGGGYSYLQARGYPGPDYSPFCHAPTESEGPQ